MLSLSLSPLLPLPFRTGIFWGEDGLPYVSSPLNSIEKFFLEHIGSVEPTSYLPKITTYNIYIEINQLIFFFFSFWLCSSLSLQISSPRINFKRKTWNSPCHKIPTTSTITNTTTHSTISQPLIATLLWTTLSRPLPVTMIPSLWPCQIQTWEVL